MTSRGCRGHRTGASWCSPSLAGGPKHGYALIKDIEDFAGVTMGPGTLSGALSKLEHARPDRSAPR